MRVLRPCYLLSFANLRRMYYVDYWPVKTRILSGVDDRWTISGFEKNCRTLCFAITNSQVQGFSIDGCHFHEVTCQVANLPFKSLPLGLLPMALLKTCRDSLFKSGVSGSGIGHEAVLTTVLTIIDHCRGEVLRRSSPW